VSAAGAVAATHTPQGAAESAAAVAGTPPAHAVHQPASADAPAFVIVTVETSAGASPKGAHSVCSTRTPPAEHVFVTYATPSNSDCS
jgi:hypothetical protein